MKQKVSLYPKFNFSNAKLIIKGNRELSGKQYFWSKNASLPILAACLLSEKAERKYSLRRIFLQ